MVVFGSRDAVAIGLSTMAGLSTCIGGLIIFNKRLVHLANPTFLGAAMGMSAGVMIFISLVEIFHESIEKFQEGLATNAMTNVTSGALGHEIKNDGIHWRKGNGWLLASLCFIGGAVIIYVMDFIVHKICLHADHELTAEELSALRNTVGNQNEAHHPSEVDILDAPARKRNMHAHTRMQLKQTGILKAVAIAIHNFPEGIATFLAAFVDLKKGIVLAVGIALHNIPEGIAVATPVYFATGNRLKAFSWTLLSALAEPLGAILCWLVMKRELNQTVEGVMFGLVSGMMVTISFKELIPSAYRYCPTGNRVALSIFGGMGIMASSLILFEYVGV
jgi:zinc transporter, ZIP family